MKNIDTMVRAKAKMAMDGKMLAAVDIDEMS